MEFSGGGPRASWVLCWQGAPRRLAGHMSLVSRNTVCSREPERAASGHWAFQGLYVLDTAHP